MGILVSMDEVGRKACFCAVWFYDSSNANPKLTTIKTIETTVMCCLIYLYQKYEQISKFYEPRVIKICHGKKNSAGTTWVNKSHKLLAKPKVTNLACADFLFCSFCTFIDTWKSQKLTARQNQQESKTQHSQFIAESQQDPSDPVQISHELQWKEVHSKIPQLNYINLSQGMLNQSKVGPSQMHPGVFYLERTKITELEKKNDWHFF